MTNKPLSLKIPMSVLIQEAADLKIICEKDKAKLLSAGLKWGAFSLMLEKLEECKKLDAQLTVYKQDCKIKTDELNTLTKECKQSRTQLSTHLAFEHARNKIDFNRTGLSQRHARADIIQDLFDLAVAAESTHKNFPSCKIDLSLAENARRLATMLSQNDAACTINNQEKTIMRKKRDDAARELQNLVNEIRALGRNAFADDPVRQKAYASGYFRNRLK